DISVIDEVPDRRLPIKNCVVGSGWRPNAYEFIRKEIEAGHQAYVICPLVEASENAEGENVTDYCEKLRQALPDGIQVDFLHGKMRSDMKNKVMEAFAANEIQVLVSTTVVEVGVNVPNATVMMIEDAQRFGLAQLHQLRGRVGRSDMQSYCIMINTSDAKGSGKRLDVLNRTNDGFQIASEDLKLRGPGDFFGIRQSGDMEFQLADIYQDARVLQQASDEVKRILDLDRALALPEHEGLLRKAQDYFERQMERLNL
ncbi:MAG: DNA helicase RecG, partial [Eubacterium sp.]|nr:DNA helicase RecG [Eubacterium sp.]